jgi:transcriptional regulator with XRE-family HTH domain
MTKGQPLQAIIATNAKAIRKRMKETQPQVADRAKARGYVLDQGTVSRIENRRLVPSIDVLEALAHGLDVEAWQLLVPGIDAKNLPVLREATPSERELWKRLQEHARAIGLET